MTPQDVFTQLPPIAVFVLYVWSLFWKALALWRSADGKQRNWFIVMLIVNTLGILEIIYLFRFAKKPLTKEEIISWKNQAVLMFRR